MSINVAANPTAAIFAVGTLIGEAPRRIEWPTPSVQACQVELQPLFVRYTLHLLNYERNIEIMTVLLISKSRIGSKSSGAERHYLVTSGAALLLLIFESGLL